MQFGSIVVKNIGVDGTVDPIFNVTRLVSHSFRLFP